MPNNSMTWLNNELQKNIRNSIKQLKVKSQANTCSTPIHKIVFVKVLKWTKLYCSNSRYVEFITNSSCYETGKYECSLLYLFYDVGMQAAATSVGQNQHTIFQSHKIQLRKLKIESEEFTSNTRQFIISYRSASADCSENVSNIKIVFSRQLACS